MSFLNLQPTGTLWKNTKLYARKVASSCLALDKYEWFRYTDCTSFMSYYESRIKNIESLKSLITDLVQTDDPQKSRKTKDRSKRGVLNFIGDVSKILFGTLSQTDAEEYNKQISRLEQEQTDFLHLTKEEMTIVRATINTLNLTINRINENEAKLKRELESLNNGLTDEIDKVQEEKEEIAMIDEQIRVVERGFEESRRSDLLV